MKIQKIQRRNPAQVKTTDFLKNKLQRQIKQGEQLKGLTTVLDRVEQLR